MTVEEALELARRHGVNVVLEGDSLRLEADAPPPHGLLAILGRGKWDIVAALRLREAEERRSIVQWVNNHFASSPPGVCVHCGDGPRSEDPSFSCLSEMIGARCMPRVTLHGWRSEKQRRAEHSGYTDDTYPQGGIRAGLIGRGIALGTYQGRKGERYVDVLRFAQAHHG